MTRSWAAAASSVRRRAVIESRADRSATASARCDRAPCEPCRPGCAQRQLGGTGRARAGAVLFDRVPTRSVAGGRTRNSQARISLGARAARRFPRACESRSRPMGGCLIAALLVNSFPLASSATPHRRRIVVVSAVGPAGRRTMRLGTRPLHVESAVRGSGRKTHRGMACVASRRGRLRPPGRRNRNSEAVRPSPWWRAKPGTGCSPSTWRGARRRSCGPRQRRRA